MNTSDVQATEPATPRVQPAATEPAAGVAHRDPATIPPRWHVGDRILDLYEVLAVHEGGGMGLVYRVRHLGWNMELAVKSPRPELFASEDNKTLFERECETWINLGLYPHTVSCYYVRRLGGIPRVFAEYVEGGSLADQIRHGTLYQGNHAAVVERILDIAIQTSWGLHFAHEQGLVHQDVKPANVLLTMDGIAKITDFGLAKARAATGERPDQSLLVSAGGMKTPAYASPEQANGQPLTRCTDIWSWAVSVLELFTGEVTWRAGPAAPQALDRYLQVGAARTDIPSMPAALADLLRRCLAREAHARPVSLLEVAQELQEILARTFKRPYTRTMPSAVERLADSWNNRAVSLLDLGKPDEANQHWESALRIDPYHPEANYNRGLSQWRGGLVTEVELLRKLREVVHSHAGAWEPKYLLALAHLEQDDVPAAVALLEPLAEQAPVAEVRSALDTARTRLAEARGLVRTFEGHTQPVYAVALSRDGRLALSGSEYLGEGDETMRLWDVAGGRCLNVMGVARQGGMLIAGIGVHRYDRDHASLASSGFYAVALQFSADGRHAFSADLFEGFRYWQTDPLECRTVFGVHEGHEDLVRSACLRDDGQQALSASDDGTLILWDVAGGKAVRTFRGHTGKVLSVHATPDLRLAVSGGDDRTLRFWDVAAGRCVHAVATHDIAVTAVALSRDGLRAASGGADGLIRIWDMAALNAQKGKSVLGGDVSVLLQPVHAGTVSAMAFTPDGQQLVWASSFDTGVQLWDLRSRRCLRTFQGHTGAVTSLSISGDGRFALSGSKDHTLKLWRLAGNPVPWSAPWIVCRPRADTGNLQARFQEALAQADQALARDDPPAGAEALRRARALPGFDRRHEAVSRWVGLYRRMPRESLRDAWEELVLRDQCVFAVTHCGDKLLSVQQDTMRWWDVAQGTCLREIRGHPAAVTNVAMDRDGRRALTGSFDGAVKLWDVASGRCVQTFGEHAGGAYAIALSQDGHWALSGGQDKLVRLWDAESGRCLRTLKAHAQTINEACLSADARFALTASADGTVKLWNLATGRCVRTFWNEKQYVWTVQLCPDQRHAVYGGADGALHYWDLFNAKCLRTWQGHRQHVTTLAVSADGRHVLSGGMDSALKLWNLTTGECVRTFAGHTSAIRKVAFSAADSLAVSCAMDGVRIWRLDWELANPGAASNDTLRARVEVFLAMHTPPEATLPATTAPSEDQIRRAFTRKGRPTWTDEDLRTFLEGLGDAGLGSVKVEEVRQFVQEMAATWSAAPPLRSDLPA